MSVKVNSWERNHVYIRSVWQQQYTVNKSINPLLCCLLWGWDSKQCSVLISAAKDRTVSMLCSNFCHGIRTGTPLLLAKTQWVETCRLRVGNIIIRSPFYVRGGAKSEGLVFFFTSLQRKAYQKKKKNFFTFSGLVDAPCTRDPIIALKHRRSFMICHL